MHPLLLSYLLIWLLLCFLIICQTRNNAIALHMQEFVYKDDSWSMLISLYILASDTNTVTVLFMQAQMQLQVRLKESQSYLILQIHLPLLIELTTKPVSFKNLYDVMLSILLFAIGISVMNSSNCWLHHWWSSSCSNCGLFSCTHGNSLCKEKCTWVDWDSFYFISHNFIVLSGNRLPPTEVNNYIQTPSKEET